MNLLRRIKNLFAREGCVSDGCHTFDELYHYRALYNAAFFNELAKDQKYNVHVSFRHNTGEYCFGGNYFIVMADLPTGRISNHYPKKYWNLFTCEYKPLADKWDGHTSQEAADRIEKYLNETSTTTYTE